MFALWYGVLSYREYRDAIWERFFSKKPATPAVKETAVVCPLPPKKPDTSKIPIVEPPKPPRTPSPLPPRSLSPQTLDFTLSPPQATSTPINGSPDTTKLEPPAKPPRSPSPHPIRAEAFEDIEYEEEEEDDDESSEVEDDENSVIASSAPRRAPISNSVNEFINQEINQPNSLRLNQTR